MSMRTKFPCSCARTTTESASARHSCLSTFRPSCVSFTETLESIFCAVKFVQQRPVAFRGVARLIETVNVFAEDIHRRAETLCVEVTRDANRVLHRFAGDVAPGNPSYDGFRNVRVRNQQLLDQQRALGVYCKSPMIKRIVAGAFILILLFAAPATPDRVPKEHAEFTFARVEFNLNGRGAINREGQLPWEHDYPRSEDFFLAMVGQVTGVHTNTEAYQIVRLDSPDIFKYPFLYFSEPGFMD